MNGMPKNVAKYNIIQLNAYHISSSINKKKNRFKQKVLICSFFSLARITHV